MVENSQKQLQAEKQLLDSIKQIKYGAVEVHIHDSKIVQIEERKKFRF